MMERFLRYSLENGRKIAAVFLKDGQPCRKNMLVTAIDPDGEHFTAVLSGKKKAEAFCVSDFLTVDYARGDHGELE